MSSNLRIILAITAKDIIDALKNRNALANIVMVLVMVVIYSVLPSFERSQEAPTLMIYDAGESSLGAILQNGDTIQTKVYPTQAAMEAQVARGNGHEIGVVIPADYDSRVAAGEVLELEGTLLRWVSDSDADELRSNFEEVIVQLTGQTAVIKLEKQMDQIPGSFSPLSSASWMVVFTLIVIGASVVPHLMIEEKENKTLEAILVSPAEGSHLVIAKALTGLFYCVLSVSVVFALNAAYVVHWELAVLVALSGALFSTALGLFFGTVFEVKQQMTIWAFSALTALLVPVFMAGMSEVLPNWLTRIVHWIPSATMSYLFQLSCVTEITLGSILPELGLVIGSGLLGLAVVIWLVRQSDR